MQCGQLGQGQASNKWQDLGSGLTHSPHCPLYCVKLIVQCLGHSTQEMLVVLIGEVLKPRNHTEAQESWRRCSGPRGPMQMTGSSVRSPGEWG